MFCALAFNLVGLIFLFAILMLQGVLPWNPQASQAAPKQAGTNGGGIVGTNSAHLFENPNALTNLFEMTLLLLIPVALCFSFGKCVKDKRQGIAIFLAMVIMLVVALGDVASCEQAGSAQKNGGASWRRRCVHDSLKNFFISRLSPNINIVSWA